MTQPKKLTQERLQEIREQLSGRRFGWPEELLSHIDALTAERDGARSAMQDRDLMYEGQTEEWDATRIRLIAERDQLRTELEESARLHGMGSEREARLMARVSELERERDSLREAAKAAAEALELHKHTDKCLYYAAKTSRNSGNYYCIAECANSHKSALAALRAAGIGEEGKNG